MSIHFGQDPTPPPRTIESLLGPGLTSAMDGLELISRKMLSGVLHGERQSRRRGSSIDFADHRPYVAGDDLRFVDWNVYARLDALFLKLYLDEEDLSVQILVDATPSMDWGAPSKWVYAKRLAMAIGSIALASRHRVSVAAFGGPRLSWARDLRGRSRTGELGRWLLELQIATEGAHSLMEATQAVAPTRRGRGVVVFISDFLEEADPLPALHVLSGRGDDVHCVQVLSPQEHDPMTSGLSGDLQLVDAEGGGRREVTVTPSLIKAYLSRLGMRIERLSDAARRCGASHALVSTDMPVETVLLSQLRRGGLLK